MICENLRGNSRCTYISIRPPGNSILRASRETVPASPCVLLRKFRSIIYGRYTRIFEYAVSRVTLPFAFQDGVIRIDDVDLFVCAATIIAIYRSKIIAPIPTRAFIASAPFFSLFLFFPDHVSPLIR